MKQLSLLAAAALIAVACATTPPGGWEGQRDRSGAAPQPVDRPAPGKQPPGQPSSGVPAAENRVAGGFQAWADANRNGILEPGEMEDLVRAVTLLVREPHPGRTPVDGMFDRNRDGSIDPEEMMQARRLLLREQLRRLYRHDPELARVFDINEDGWIGLFEIAPFNDLLLFPEARRPRQARGPFEQRMDGNRDGFIDEREIREFINRMLRRIVLLPVEPQPERRDLPGKEAIFAYLDLDGTGALEPPERLDLAFLAMELLAEPGHGVHTPMDQYFDRNRDGRIDAGEVELAERQMLEAALKRLFETAPELAGRFFDRDQDRRIEGEEVRTVLQRLFRDPAFREPHRVADALDQRLDQNRNGRVEGPEIVEFGDQLVLGISLAWLQTPEEGEERLAVHSLLEEMADLDRNGILEPGEVRLMERGLAGPHPVETAFDRRIDFDRNGEIEPLEIQRAKRAGTVAAEETGGEPPGSLPPVTPIDRYLDLNGDRRVEEEEIQAMVDLLRGDPQRGGPAAPGRWPELLDADRDGRVSRGELEAVREKILRPHPAAPGSRLDQELDANRDGFIDPQEIGIAAGWSEGREVPSIDARLERQGWRQEQQQPLPQPVVAAGKEGKAPGGEAAVPEYTRKLGLVQDRKLAVLGISSGTQNVDQETAGGVSVFIENAFVNVGKVRVIDRQNIEKLLQEHEFQASDLVDEAKAVEIGKLSGADIIVVGSISYVGKKYFLNIKLISVESGEIIGSSIADSTDAGEFYGMCNEAVFKLF